MQTEIPAVKPPSAARSSVPSWDGRRLQVWVRRRRGAQFVASVVVPERPAAAAWAVREVVLRADLSGEPLMVTCFPPVVGCRALRNASGAWKGSDWLPFGASTITDPGNHDAMQAALTREQRVRDAAARQNPERLLSAVLTELRALNHAGASLSALRKLLRKPAHQPGFAGRLTSAGGLRAALDRCVEAGHAVAGGRRWFAVARVPHPSIGGLTIPAGLDPNEPGLSLRGREDRAAALDNHTAGNRRRGGS